jgi:hypothetical protein
MRLMVAVLALSGCASISSRDLAYIGQGADVASTAYVLRTTDAQELNGLYTLWGGEWWQVTASAVLVKYGMLRLLKATCGARECSTAWKIAAGFGFGATGFNLSQAGGS